MRRSIALYIFVVAGTTADAAERIIEIADESKDGKLTLRVCFPVNPSDPARSL